MTVRGLLAPLSPTEVGALRRVAGGATILNFLPNRAIKRLQQLGLTETKGSRVYLTETGKKRICQRGPEDLMEPPNQTER
ncbi:hypothetical protein [Reyranella sp.]|uniref:hypothetical protein n=1 Tax=Reyranella sp. TaxID=1929291 RepID=UPI003BAB49EB